MKYGNPYTTQWNQIEKWISLNIIFFSDVLYLHSHKEINRNIKTIQRERKIVVIMWSSTYDRCKTIGNVITIIFIIVIDVTV